MNKSIFEDDQKNVCYICGRYGQMDLHHCLHGPRRAKADQYGLFVHLCPACHRALHDKGLNDRKLETEAQRRFEQRYTPELFMEEFGKNFI